VNELPIGWVEASLGELGDEVRGSVVPAPGVTYELYSVPTFPTRRPEILDGSEIGSAKRPVRPGDVLLCKINPRINRVWIVGDSLGRQREQIASTEYLVLRTGSIDLSRYLAWYLQSPSFREWIGLSVEGATGSHTRAKSGPILRQRIPVPPLNEQRRIVATIDKQFSRLDAAGQMLRRAESRTRMLRTAMIDAAAEEAVDRWGWTSVAGVCEAIVNGNTPRADKMRPGSGDIPFIKVYNLTTYGALDFSKRPTFIERETHLGQLKRSRLRPGDVLTNIVGPPLGKVAVVPPSYEEWNMNQAVVAFRTLPDLLSAELLALWLQSRRIMQPLLETARATAGQFNLSISACRRLMIPVPPPDEQARIVDDAARRLSIIASLGGSIAAADTRSAALRRSILERAFRGELVTHDPTDEPASKLLERNVEQAIARGPDRGSKAIA
jgi:type I restriction enzyme, S subunit